jgi:hypothetical protein
MHVSVLDVLQTHAGNKIVHFTGHGNTKAALLLEKDDGSCDEYPRDQLWSLLSSGIGSDVRCGFGSTR